MPGMPPRITWALPLPTIELAQAARAPAVFWLEMLDRLHFATAPGLKAMSLSKSTNAWFATGGVMPVQVVGVGQFAGLAASDVAVRTWITALTFFFFGSLIGEISPVIVCLTVRVAPKATPATPTQSVSASAP